MTMSQVYKFTVPSGHKWTGCVESYGRALDHVAMFKGAENNMGYMVATNGRILAALPTQEAGHDLDAIINATIGTTEIVEENHGGNTLCSALDTSTGRNEDGFDFLDGVMGEFDARHG
jgi:hypothetical protein